MPLVTVALDELNYSYDDAASELDRLHRPGPLYVPSNGAIQPEICAACHEFNAQVFCEHCKRGWHTLCLRPPVLKKQSFQEGDIWRCQACGAENTVSSASSAQTLLQVFMSQTGHH